jgi:colanic acid biosynthesis glycosyl transferase WcaI
MVDIRLLLQNLGAAGLVLSSKLPGMLARGHLMIATSLAESQLAAVVSKCGIVVPLQVSVAPAEANCRLADDLATRLGLGRRARAHAEAIFERDAILECA